MGARREGEGSKQWGVGGLEWREELSVFSTRKQHVSRKNSHGQDLDVYDSVPE